MLYAVRTSPLGLRLSFAQRRAAVHTCKALSADISRETAKNLARAATAVALQMQRLVMQGAAQCQLQAEKRLKLSGALGMWTLQYLVLQFAEDSFVKACFARSRAVSDRARLALHVNSRQRRRPHQKHRDGAWQGC